MSQDRDTIRARLELYKEFRSQLRRDLLHLRRNCQDPDNAELASKIAREL